jgi:SAM-dependent methyltransferase
VLLPPNLLTGPYATQPDSRNPARVQERQQTLSSKAGAYAPSNPKVRVHRAHSEDAIRAMSISKSKAEAAQSTLSLVPAPRRARDLLKRTSFPIHPFDQMHGVDTSGLVPAKHLLTGHANDEHITAYYGVAPSILRALIGHWRETVPPHPIEDYTFVDVGAGKGRGLMVASEYGFRKVAGIELNHEMAAIARQNVEHWTRAYREDPTAGRIAPIEIFEQDALEYDLPQTPTLLFLFHPFEAPVLKQLLRRIETQFARRQGALDLLYVNAECADVIDRNPGFTQLFLENVPMSPVDHSADLEAIARQKEYGSTGDEECAIYRYTGRARGSIFDPAA